MVGRLTVVVFGGIFSLSGAIGGIFGQNYGAGQIDRVRSTYRDALVFCLGYTVLAWAILLWARPSILWAFGLVGRGVEVFNAFCFVGIGGYVFIGALFVSNAAFNNLGKPSRSALINWVKDGVLSWPAATACALAFGAAGVIYGQAITSICIGTLAGLWGWRFIQGLAPDNRLVGTVPLQTPDIHRRRL